MNKQPSVFGSVLSAFVIGCGASFGVGLLFSSGKLNAAGLIGVGFAGAIAAAKDYRSLMQLPPVKNGNGDTQTFTDKP